MNGIYQIIKETGISPDKVEKVKVGSFDLCTRHPFSNSHPKTFEEAIFSTKYLIALAIMGIPPGPNWYQKELLNSPEVLALADKVTLCSDEEANSYWPERMLAKVILYTSDQSFCKRVDFPLGEPENPMTEEDITNKFMQLTKTFFNTGQQQQCLEFIQNLEKKEKAAELVNLLTISHSRKGVVGLFDYPDRRR
ncbi:hypothetical protein ACFLWZ_05410 [Chloroflexota bacterium]